MGLLFAKTIGVIITKFFWRRYQQAKNSQLKKNRLIRVEIPRLFRAVVDGQATANKKPDSNLCCDQFGRFTRMSLPDNSLDPKEDR
jgi:hypothetical protein